MKQKLFIFLFLFLLVAVLAGLNAASYKQKEKTPDNEMMPNRSTYNSGATGMQAFYTLLTETGRKAVRWQEAPAALLTTKTNKPTVFVVTGTLKRDFMPDEASELLRWVSAGGRLVLIDREPPEELVKTSTMWTIAFDSKISYEILSADPSDQKQMTAGTQAAKPVQPSMFTQNVNAVQPSQFASLIVFDRKSQNVSTDGDAPPPRAMDPVVTQSDISPAVHVAGNSGNLVVDAPYGQGRIVYLSDPFIVSNGGIAMVDNAKLAINLVAAGDQTIAFDEYHQGYGADNYRFLQFFSGTPVVAIFLHAAALIGFIFFSQSRRFARAVPEPEPDRLSKLEYVGAMAELQQRTKAYDLAIENIYTDFRRRAFRYFGLDNYTAKSSDIAAMIAERDGFDKATIEDMLFKCEEIIRGEPTNKREVVRLAETLRAIEQKLGMTRKGRTRI